VISFSATRVRTCFDHFFQNVGLLHKMAVYELRFSAHFSWKEGRIWWEWIPTGRWLKLLCIQCIVKLEEGQYVSKLKPKLFHPKSFCRRRNDFLKKCCLWIKWNWGIFQFSRNFLKRKFTNLGIVLIIICIFTRNLPVIISLWFCECELPTIKQMGRNSS